MKKLILSLAAVVVMLALSPASKATVYGDSTGETISASILDISSVEVTHTPTDLVFKINLVGDPVATDWGKYMIGLDTTLGGDVAGNGWGRPIGMSTGMDYWVGSWVDSGNGVQVHQYSGVWSQIGASGPFAGGPPAPGLAISKAPNEVLITIPQSLIGIGAGSTICFDVYTSGGGNGDGAIDALGNPLQSIANWGDYYNSGSQYNVYTIPAVPEPTSMGLVFGGAALLLVNSVRRKA
jgi:hypothetical protein